MRLRHDGDRRSGRCEMPAIDRNATRDARKASRADRNRYGAVCTLKRSAYRMVRRLFKFTIVNVFLLDIDPLRQRPLESSRFGFRFLSADEIRKLADDPANDLDAALAGRLELGHEFCFAAFDGGQLANYSWYAQHHIEPEHSLGAGLTMPDDTMYVYKGFTLPAYRGQRLNGATIQRAAQIFAGMGIERFVGVVEYANWASVRSCERLGFRRIGSFACLGHKLISRRCDSNVTGLGFGK